MAWRCNRCSLWDVISGLVFESLRLLLRPHCVVESRRPFCPVGLVAGGVTELVIIVGGGRVRIESVPVLTVVVLTTGRSPRFRFRSMEQSLKLWSWWKAATLADWARPLVQ